MYIKAIAGANVGPFRGKFRYDFVNGTVGIFGSNGVGKSTLMNLIYLAITNSYARFSGKESVVNDNADGAAKLTVVVATDGGDIVIERGITAGRHKLMYGDVTVSGADAVDQALLEITQIPKDVWGSCAFKEQNEIYDFLQLTPSLRAKFFHTICGTGKCEQVWKILGDTCTRLERKIDSGTIASDLAEALADFRKLRQAKQEAVAEYHKQREIYNTIKPKAAEARKLVDRDREYRSARAERSGLEAKIADINSRLSHMRAEWKQLDFEVTNELLDALADKVAKFKTAIRERTEDDAAYAAWARAVETAEECKKKITELRKEDVLQNDEDELNDNYQTANDVASALRARIASQTKQLKYAESGDLVECETCGTPVSDMVPIAERKRKIAEDKKELAEAEELVAKTRKVLQQFAKVTSELASAAARLKSVASMAKDMPKRRHAPLDTLRDELQEASEAQYTALSKRKRANDLSTMVQKLKADKLAKSEELAKLPNPEPVNDDELQEAVKLLQKFSAVEAALTVRMQTAKSYSELGALTAAKNRVKSLQVRQKASEKAQILLDRLSRLRELFHRDGLPAKLAVENLARLCGPVNNQLNNFGHPFMLDVTDSLDFIVVDSDGNKCPASRLSIGQQVVLAVAFWTALGDMWQDGLGVLVLDEPTANLDEDNKTHLANMLERLTEQGINRQLFVVTHEQSLKPYFSQVVSL